MGDKRLTAGQKIGILRQHFALSQAQMAMLLGISRSTIAAYETRTNASPTMDKIHAWSDRFGIPASWWLDGSTLPPVISRDYRQAEKEAKAGGQTTVTAIHPDELTYDEEDFANPEMVKVPLWTGVQAGIDETHFIEERRPRQIDVPKFFFSRKKADRFIVAIPNGRSMAPRIVHPDRIITFLSPEAPPNSIVVARREDNVNFVKVLRIDRMGNKELHSINDEFPPIVKLLDWTLRAAVVGIWKPYVMEGPNIEFNGGHPLRA